MRVVILGGGFGGVMTARALARRVRRRAPVEIHLVSDENYFVFQPMLPEVVSCGLEPSHIINPIRQLCPGVSFHCAAMQHIDLTRREVTLTGADARKTHVLPFDHLVIALGQTMDLSRIPGMAEHSLPIKTLGDAFHLRNHVLSRLEEADIEDDPETRARLLTFVAVGGGFSGVETIAELNDMIKAVLAYYPRARATGCRMVLLHSRERILNELSADLADFAQKKLRARGVELRLSSRVSEATDGGVTLADGTALNAGTVVSTVGNAAHPFVARTSLPQQAGRILVDEFLRVTGFQDLWALGDAALVPDVHRGGHCPPTAQYAMRQGAVCARNILATIAGRPLKPFRFGGLGQMAIVGRRCGVASILGIKIAGILAWFLWRSVYWFKLPGLRSKIRVGIDWALDVFFPRDIAKLAVGRTEVLHRAHYRAGEAIIRQGEIADRFYIIESGEVEVVREAPGEAEQRLAVRCAGDAFGEVALLKDTPRTATVRCLTPVDVIAFSRKEFRSMVGSYDSLRRLLEQKLRDYENPK